MSVKNSRLLSVSSSEYLQTLSPPSRDFPDWPLGPNQPSSQCKASAGDAGSNTRSMQQSPVRIGFAGYGNFGKFLSEAWSSLENVQIVAAATSHPAENLRIYDHWEKLLLDREVDLVAITTPPNLHAAIAGAAMEAGKHVLIEKPVATALSDADSSRSEIKPSAWPPSIS
jgi:Oxidoreductase family, NAD-binding Rossmann fold